MYCPKCGTKLAREAIFCHKCGSKMPSELLESNTPTEVQSEDYDTLFSYPAEIKEKESSEPAEIVDKAVSSFLKLDPHSKEETDIKSDLNFDIPEDWDAEPEKKSVEKAERSKVEGGSLNFDIPDDWGSLDDDNSNDLDDDTPGEYSEDVLNFTIPENWDI